MADFDIFKEIEKWTDQAGELHDWYYINIINNPNIVYKNPEDKKTLEKFAASFKTVVFKYRNEFIEAGRFKEEITK